MRPIPAPRLGDTHGLLRAINQRDRLRLDEFITEFSIEELFPPGLENALGRTRQFVSFARSAGLLKEDRGVVELTEVGKRYVRSGDDSAVFDVSSGQAEWLRRQLGERHMTDSIYHGAAIGLSLYASNPPGFHASRLDFGRALAHLGRAGWDNENTLESQGERYTTFLRDLELLNDDDTLTEIGIQVKSELTLPIHASLRDLAGQLNPGGPEAAEADGQREWADGGGAEPAAEPAAPEPAAAESGEYEEVRGGTTEPSGRRPPEPAGGRPVPPSDVWETAAPDEATRAYSAISAEEAAAAAESGQATEARAVPQEDTTDEDAGAAEPGLTSGDPLAAPGVTSGDPLATAEPQDVTGPGVESPTPDVAADAQPSPAEAEPVAADAAPTEVAEPESPGAEAARAGMAAADAAAAEAVGTEAAEAEPAEPDEGVAAGGPAAAGEAPAEEQAPAAAVPADEAPAAEAPVPVVETPPEVVGEEAAAVAAEEAAPIEQGEVPAAAAEAAPIEEGEVPAAAEEAAPIEEGEVPAAAEEASVIEEGEVPAPVAATAPREPSGFLDLAVVRSAAEGEGLKLPDSVYAAAVAALSSGKHLVITGPAGSGKTTLALAIAKAAVQAGRSAGAALATASPKWTAQDTVGRVDESGFTLGHVLGAAGKKKWLIVDELDRAKLDKAFGDLSSFLGGLPLSLPDGSREVAAPKEWRIVATADADRGNGHTSAALLRRFAHIRLPRPDRADLESAIDDATEGDATAAAAVKRLLAVDVPELGAGPFLDAARHAAERNALAPTTEDELAREALAAYIAPHLRAEPGRLEAIEREL